MIRSTIIDYFDVTFSGKTLFDLVGQPDEDGVSPGGLFARPYRPNTLSKGRFGNVSRWFEGATIYEGLKTNDGGFDPEYLRLEIKGAGMRELNQPNITGDQRYNHYLVMSLAELIGIKKIGRLDFTIDVKGNLLPKCRAHFKKGAFVSRSKGRGRIKAIYDMEHDEDQTIYVGSKRSITNLTIYNKRIEVFDRTKTDIGTDLTRFEMTLRDERSTELFNQMMKVGPGKWHTVGSSWMYNYLDFKDFRSCQHFNQPTKAETAAWWRLIVRDQKKTRFTGNLFKELDESQWLKRAMDRVGNQVAIMSQVYGDHAIDSLKDKTLDIANTRTKNELLRQIKSRKKEWQVRSYANDKSEL